MIDQSPEWRALQAHRQAVPHLDLRAEFARDAARFNRFSTEACGLFLDYSKNLVTEETVRLLLSLARAAGVL